MDQLHLALEKEDTKLLNDLETYLSRVSDYCIWQIVLNSTDNQLCGILMF
jgi:hypothetical protein